MYLKKLHSSASCIWILAFLIILSGANQAVLAQNVPITDPSDSRQLNEAVELFSQGHLEAVQPIVQRLVNKYPKCSLPWRLLASCLFLSYQANHLVEDARKCAKQAIALEPDDSFAYQLLADIEVETGHYRQAIVYANRGLRCKIVDLRNLRSRSCAWTNLNKPDAALADYSKYLETSPVLSGNRKCQLAKAKLCQAAGHLQEALDIYAKLQKKAYADSVPPLQATILVKMHKDGEALDVLNELIRKIPGDEMAFVARAHLFESLGRLPDAVKDYSSAIAIDRQANLYIARANLYDKLGQKEKAAQDRKSASIVDSH
jgi:tetratricopeptide (TPR) repeat protein